MTTVSWLTKTFTDLFVDSKECLELRSQFQKNFSKAFFQAIQLFQQRFLTIKRLNNADLRGNEYDEKGAKATHSYDFYLKGPIKFTMFDFKSTSISLFVFLN